MEGTGGTFDDCDVKAAAIGVPGALEEDVGYKDALDQLQPPKL